MRSYQMALVATCMIILCLSLFFRFLMSFKSKNEEIKYHKGTVVDEIQ